MKLRLRYKVAAIVLTVTIVAIVGYYIIAKPLTRIVALHVEPKDKEWKECEKYLVRLEITLPNIPSERPQFSGVKVYLNWTLIHDVKIVNVTARPSLELSEIIVVLIVHPQRGIVSAGVCLKFDLTIEVELEIEHPVLLGSKRTKISGETPPASIILCS